MRQYHPLERAEPYTVVEYKKPLLDKVIREAAKLVNTTKNQFLKPRKSHNQ